MPNKGLGKLQKPIKFYLMIVNASNMMAMDLLLGRPDTDRNTIMKMLIIYLKNSSLTLASKLQKMISSSMLFPKGKLTRAKEKVDLSQCSMMINFGLLGLVQECLGFRLEIWPALEK